MNYPVAIVISVLIIVAAVFFRFDLQVGSGPAFRLDRLTGQVTVYMSSGGEHLKISNED